MTYNVFGGTLNPAQPNNQPVNLLTYLLEISGLATLMHINRDGRKSRQKMANNTADLCENRKNTAKITAKTRQIQHPTLSTIITCSARFSSVKFCHCGALTNSRKR